MNIIARASLALTAVLFAQPAYASWTITDIAATDVSHVSQNLWISPGGSQIHRVVYRNSTSGSLRLATRTNSGSGWSGWNIVNVASNPASDNALAVSTNGVPYIAYHDMVTRNLHLTWYTACFFPGCTPSWTTVRVDGSSNNTTADFGRNVSLALVENSNGTVRSIHLAATKHPDTGFASVRYSRCLVAPDCGTTGGWVSEAVPVSRPTDDTTGITASVDSAGNTNAHVYVSIDNPQGPERGLYRAAWGSLAGGGWGSAFAISGLVGSISMKKVDGGGYMMSLANNTNVYFARTPSWVFERVSADGAGGPDADPLIDEYGTPVVAYCRTVDDDLLVARKINGAWTREVVASVGAVGHNVRIDEDLDGNFLVPYRDATANRLKLATGD